MVAHHHGSMAALDGDDRAQRVRIAQPDLRAGEMRRHRVGGSMVDDRHSPPQRARGARHRLGVGARPANQHMRGRCEELYERARAPPIFLPIHSARCALADSPPRSRHSNKAAMELLRGFL